MSRVFAPLQATHPLVGEPCLACKQPFVAGDRVTLIALGPSDDPEEQARARQGRKYLAVGAPIHASCAGLEAT